MIAAFERETVAKDVELKQRLGDHSTIDPLTLRPVGAVATKRDPKCRFM